MLAAIILTGCATLASHEHASMLKQAIRDDQTCRARGWSYPEPRYVTCRMQLDDKRQYRDWMNLQIMRQNQYQNPSAVPAALPRETYRPLDRGHYHCRYVTEKDQDYILCGETPKN
jgi:hypothetical protein